MSNKEELYDLIQKYIIAIKSNKIEDVIQAKCDLILYDANFISVISNYIALYENGIDLKYGSYIIDKGTQLYRILCFDDNTDFSDVTQWNPNPKRTENRANIQGEEALYLSNDEFLCRLETHLKPNQKYVVGTYECTEDIELGSFIAPLSDNEMYRLIGMVLNAFLIAPSRSDKNQDLFHYLDNKYGQLDLDDFSIYDISTMDLQFKYGVLNENDMYYKLTNMICNTLKKYHPNGIRYSSCYMPIDTVGVKSSMYNVVLYSTGIKKIQFRKHEVKSNDFNYNETDVVRTLLESDKND